MSAWSLLAASSFGIWLYLLLGRGGFWREQVVPPADEPRNWPDLVAIVPARDEAPHVADAIRSLLSQRYTGAFFVVLVDDHSGDGTAEIARRTAAELGASERLTILAAPPLPPGWTGKLWALHHGLAEVARSASPPPLVLFADADIVHHPTNLRELVARMEIANFGMVSLMVRLRRESLAERFLVPAFVFFFEMLYPFAWVRDPGNRTAAAAGGCMLVRRETLEKAGGLRAIRGEIIDDCALARALKREAPIWLGLSQATRSLRPYPRVRDVWRMVARSAYAQLRYSPLLLGGTILGMSLTFLAPVAVVLSRTEAAPLGLAAWAAMAFGFLPTLRLYQATPVWAPLLPLIALVYIGATIDSARRHWLGLGGEWKGRIQRRSSA